MSDRAPLAERMRPRRLDEVVGQRRWLGPDGVLRRAVGAGTLRSLVLWGPPGCGKTTLARLLAEAVGARFVPLSAVLDGVKQLRDVLDGLDAPTLDPRPTALFVDEIHRWNKAQQDALLPHVERGRVVLLGATTENPSFELVPALRSRLLVVHLDPLDEADLVVLLDRAMHHPDGLGRPALVVESPVIERLARLAGGDARRALGDLERLVDVWPDGVPLRLDDADGLLPHANLRHDRDGEDHFDVVSAWIKSMRGSDPDAAIYWLARLIEAGEDVRFLGRRLVVFAAEDVGNADPRGLLVAESAAAASDRVGLPEARIVLAQATTWLACAPKSNASYVAMNRAIAEVRTSGARAVPLHLRNATTEAARREGYGSGYLYPHDHPFAVVDQAYRPDGITERYYEPTSYGDERVIRERLAWWAERRGRR